MNINTVIVAALGPVVVGLIAACFRQRKHSRAAHRQVAALQQELEALQAPQQRFYSMLSHELRTPLSSILGFSELLLGESNESEVNQDIRKIQAAGMELLNLVNDLLVISGMESDGQTEGVVFSAETTLLDVVAVLQPLASNNDNQLSAGVSGPVPGLVGDVARIEKVLFSIIANLSKLTRHVAIDVLGGYAPAADGGEHFVISIACRGLQSGELERLVQRQNHTGFTAATRLMEELHGDLAIVSQDDCDAVELHLPVTADVSEPGPDAILPGRPGTNRALVISENNDFALLLSRMLSHRAFDVSIADEGASGKEIACKSLPDLILLDLDMLALPGMAVLQHLKFDRRTSHIPVITCSAVTVPDEVLRHGAAGFLEKPVTNLRIDRCLKSSLPLVA